MYGSKELDGERTVRRRNRFYKDLQRGQQSLRRNIKKMEHAATPARVESLITYVKR